MHKIHNLDKYFLYKINHVLLKSESKSNKSLKPNMYTLTKL